MRIIGLLSGTSVDAIDAALVHMHQHDDELALTIEAFASTPFEPALRQRIQALIDHGGGGVAAVCELNVEIGVAFAAAACALMQAHPARPVDLIASHGQTVYHQVAAGHTRATLQLGAAAEIAERTGVATVSDVRSRDVAAGGQGAPLAPYLDALLFGSAQHDRVLLNIGGIANVTLIPAGAPWSALACDTGPGNALIDGAMMHISAGAERFDRDGARAARGRIADALLAGWLSDPYFAAAAPKSTGRERFGRAFLDAALAHDLADDDLLATLTALSARSIAAMIRRLTPAAEVIVSGGGAHNHTLWRGLHAALGAAYPLRPSRAFGLAEDAKEAVLFAVLGLAHVQRWPANLPRCTGAGSGVVLGSLTPGRDGAVPVVHPRPAPRRARLVIAEEEAEHDA